MRVSQETEVAAEATISAVEQYHSLTSRKLSKTTFGGYGELHYNSLERDESHLQSKDEMDFHRFVMFTGHQFSDDVRFFLRTRSGTQRCR